MIPTRRCLLVFLSVLLPLAATAKVQEYKVASPSGELELSIQVDASVSWGLSVKGTRVIDGSAISLKGSMGEFGKDAKVKKAVRAARSEHIVAPFYRQAGFDAKYNSLSLVFKDGWGLEARAYDDGVAYRIVNNSRTPSGDVYGETAEFNFCGSYPMLVPFVLPNDVPYKSSFENTYSEETAGYADEGKLAFTPVYVDAPAGKLLIMEADVENYPGMFLRPTDKGFRAEFPPVAGDAAKGIARSVEGRSYPWRIIGYAADDTGLPLNNMVYALGSPNRVDDISWIKPGQSTWDWWNGNARHGVDFESGINTASYKYDVDFAARYGIPYVLVDAGWYETGPDPSKYDMTRPVEGMDVRELCRYAESKGVKIVLWCSKGALYPRMEQIFDMYSAMGVSGFKVDYFDSQDQFTVNMSYRILESAARHRLVVDLHGFYKPTGNNRTWPNLLNVEGVFGLENVKWMNADTDMPRNDATIAFIRQAAGYHDYTPGALKNAMGKRYRSVYSRPESQSTRAHQVALYIVFDMPFAMLCDSSSDYLREDATTGFITSIPTVFDHTRVLSGKVGESVVIARRKGDCWYVGGITDSSARSAAVDLSFLPEGKWNVELFRDGVNSDVVGEDFSLVRIASVDNTTSIPVDMVAGGGFAMIIKPGGKI